MWGSTPHLSVQRGERTRGGGSTGRLGFTLPREFGSDRDDEGPGGALHHLEGTGNATHLGRFSIVSDFTVNMATVTAVGTATWTAANGDQMFTTASGEGVVTFPTLATDETHTITGGTGRFAGVSGTIEVQRSINLLTLASSATITGTIDFGH